MKRLGILAVAVSFALSPISVQAQTVSQTPSVTQSQLDCVAPDSYIKVFVDTSIPADTTIQDVKVYFKAASTANWYWVEASRSGDMWVALLPQASAGTRAIQIRSVVELTNGTDGSSDIEEIPVRDGCPATVLTDADLQAAENMTIGTTAPSASLPEGFNSVGIVAVMTQNGTLVASTTLGGVGAGAATTAAGGTTILGMSAATAAIVGGAVVAGAVIIENNRDKSNSPN